MSTYTTNYNLEKPDTSDEFKDFRQSYNDNMDIIDQNLGGGGGSGGHTIIDENDQTMTQRTGLQFTGNVEVTDDSVNDKTVVNMPYEVVHLTQAQYDALPNTKLTDGKIYCITDVYSGGSDKLIGLGDCYSTSEREIGCWLNGKPLYKKAFSINAQSNTISTSLLNNLDIQFVTNLYLIVWQSQNFYVDFVNIKWNSNTKLLILPSTSVFVLALVVEYTKTTDTAGSGDWTPSGVPTHHYSTTEQVIGTWIGGIPLYERTFSISEISVSADSWYEITSIDTTNMKQLISNKCLLSRNGMEWGLLSTQKSNNNKLNVFNPRNGNIAFDTIVLQYTKTS